MKLSLSRIDPNGAVLSVVSLVAAIVAVTCAGPGRVSGRAHAPAPASVEAPASGSAIQPPPDLPQALALGAAVTPAESAAKSDSVLALPAFYGALKQLEQHTRTEPVRILWLGDSHIAADFWSDVVRQHLQQRFGVGGPGFVRIGQKFYRHSGARVDRLGSWRVEPHPPSLRSKSDDGVFGEGGARAVAHAGDAHANVAPLADMLRGRTRWTLEYRLPKGAHFRVVLGAMVQTVTAATKAEVADESPIAHLSFTAEGTEPLELRDTVGEPQFFGVVVESAEPGGVVVDTLGIDGARAATPLAWDEGQWVAEASFRNPSLVIVAYGTNEAFDAQSPDAYVDHYRQLVGRIRRIASHPDCLIIGPPDAADSSGASEPRVAEITVVERRAAEELGCAFFSAAAAMGGPGSFGAWMLEKPPLAKSDRVHLTPGGYVRLGEETWKALMSGYDAAK